MRNTNHVLNAALEYVEAGYCPVPIPPREKGPKLARWPELRVTTETVAQYFETEQNIGLILGIGGLVDVDCDSQTAVAAARQFLPETGFVYGRASKPQSHYFFIVDGTLPATKRYLDPLDKSTLIEIRGTKAGGEIGCQSVVPPSIHRDTGEAIRFEVGVNRIPAVVGATMLAGTVGKIAAAALLAKYWPAENRHEFELALAGALAKGGMTEEDARDFVVKTYCSVPTHDVGAISRVERSVSDTFNNHDSGAPHTGLKRVTEFIDAKVAALAMNWLGLTRNTVGSEFLWDSKGEIRPILANALTVLRVEDEMRGVLARNTFSLAIHALKPTPWGFTGVWDDLQDGKLTDWMQHKGVMVPAHVVSQAVNVIAAESEFHPVRDYLNVLTWDGTRRLRTWLIDYLGAECGENGELRNYVETIGERWLISAVARIYRPGCQADQMLVLEGAQGVRKSTTARALFDPWFSDDIEDLGSKGSKMSVAGVWCIEIAEMDAASRKDINTVKGFITRRVDRFRPPYGRRLIEHARQCVLIATTNDSDYLRDETGGRRFWPVKLPHLIDVDRLKKDRNQLWAEAVQRFREGAIWHIDAAESELLNLACSEQERRTVHHPWAALIKKWVEDYDHVSVAEVLAQCINKRQADWTRADLTVVGKILSKFGWRQYQMTSELGRQRRWAHPEGGDRHPNQTTNPEF